MEVEHTGVEQMLGIVSRLQDLRRLEAPRQRMEDIGVEEGLDTVHLKRVHSLDNLEHKNPPGLPFSWGKMKGDYGYIL